MVQQIRRSAASIPANIADYMEYKERTTMRTLLTLNYSENSVH